MFLTELVTYPELFVPLYSIQVGSWYSTEFILPTIDCPFEHTLFIHESGTEVGDERCGFNISVIFCVKVFGTNKNREL